MIIGSKSPLKNSYSIENTTTIEYKIEYGDTLWSIASKFNHKNYEKFIYIVKNLNNLEDATIFVDQILVLPKNI
tara:strand:+ start:5887 stop:6108 length:222 start_codon:yes stop_codon:yes gene_type:complete